MSQKNIASILILIATALGGPVALQHVTAEKVEDRIEVQGPSSVEVGQMVRLTYDARDVDWISPTGDFQIIRNGEAVISFRSPGEYKISAAGKVGESVQLDEHVILVGKIGTPTPVGPEHSVIDDSPSPEPVSPDEVRSVELTELVYQWCQETGADKEVAKQVADNFITAASTTETVQELLNKTTELNRAVDSTKISAVLVRTQKYLLVNLPGKDYVTYQCAWDEIAMGLIKWSKS